MKGKHFFKKIYFSSLLLLLVQVLSAQQGSSASLADLDKIIDITAIYDAQKYSGIAKQQQLFNQLNNKELPVQYEFNLKMYEEYKIFKFDTAFLYAKKLEEIALNLDDPYKIAQSKLKLAFVLLSAGMYWETNDALSQVNITGQPDSLKAEYYLLRGRHYYDVVDYNDDKYFYPVYFKKAGEYLDSALALFPHESFEYIYYSGLKQMKAGALDNAFDNFKTLINRPGLTDHQLAIAASTLSYIYVTKGQIDTGIEYQVRAAMADIRSSTKETFAILNLSQLLFSKGNFKSASSYIKKAINDASSYGARQRKVQLSTIMPIIQGSEINYIENQRKLWILYGAVVSVILLLFGYLMVTISRQNKKLKSAQQVISEAHTKLSEVNTELQVVNSDLLDVNTKLEDANKIKEEYIAYFFNTDSQLYARLEDIKNTLLKKIAERKFDEAKFFVDKIDPKREKEELLQNFDKLFLKLFPHFIKEMNSLLIPSEQIHMKENELLNTDLRIFALIRMGIADTEKIAQILGYSVKTIYAYKTKVKNKSVIANEEFEQRIMKIKAL